MKSRLTAGALFLLVALLIIFLFAEKDEISIQNGWFTHNGRVIWGYGQYSALWAEGHRPNLGRNSPGIFGPGQTENLQRLTDEMVRYGYPAIAHQFGLWYDRRRDAHDVACRADDKAEPPFLEQPWMRSEEGTACDGLPLYDLTKFNDWYFSRLSEFAHLGDQRGVILYNNHFLQHALLESQSHYVDFPFRPGNSLHSTGFPKVLPAARQFYSLEYPGTNDLFRRYVRRILDEVGEYQSVIHFVSEEYTGPVEFVRYWMDLILEWENEEAERDVKLGISATKDVLDIILEDPEREPLVDAIDLRYFWYRKEDGSLNAIRGGTSFPGRYFVGRWLKKESSPEMVFRQTLEYRTRYPNKVIFHSLRMEKEFQIAFLMAGGSINIAKIGRGRKSDLQPDYGLPKKLRKFQPTLNFIRSNLEYDLATMKTDTGIVDPGQGVYALANSENILIYNLHGISFDLNLDRYPGDFSAEWFNPDDGMRVPLEKSVPGTRTTSLEPPDKSDWLLLLKSQ